MTWRAIYTAPIYIYITRKTGTAPVKEATASVLYHSITVDMHPLLVASQTTVVWSRISGYLQCVSCLRAGAQAAAELFTK
jgi:hypothetical protein